MAAFSGSLMTGKTRGGDFPRSPDGRRLYAVNELDDYEGTKGGAVSAYAVEMDGSLHFLNRLPVMGAAPCHVDCAPEEGIPKYVYTANYNGGSMSAIQLKEDGSLESLEFLLQHESAERMHHVEEGYPQSTEKKAPACAQQQRLQKDSVDN